MTMKKTMLNIMGRRSVTIQKKKSRRCLMQFSSYESFDEIERQLLQSLVLSNEDYMKLMRSSRDRQVVRATCSSEKSTMKDERLS